MFSSIWSYIIFGGIVVIGAGAAIVAFDDDNDGPSQKTEIVEVLPNSSTSAQSLDDKPIKNKDVVISNEKEEDESSNNLASLENEIKDNEITSSPQNSNDHVIAELKVRNAKISEKGFVEVAGTGQKNWNIWLELEDAQQKKTKLSESQINQKGDWELASRREISPGHYKLKLAMSSPDGQHVEFLKQTIPLVVLEQNNDINLAEKVSTVEKEISNEDEINDENDIKSAREVNEQIKKNPSNVTPDQEDESEAVLLGDIKQITSNNDENIADEEAKRIELSNLSDEVKEKIEQIADIDVEQLQDALDNKQKFDGKIDQDLEKRDPMFVAHVNLSSNGNFYIEGRGHAGDFIRHFVDGLYIGDAPIDMNGRWNLTTNLDLENGKHILLSQDRDRVLGVVYAQNTHIFTSEKETEPEQTSPDENIIIVQNEAEEININENPDSDDKTLLEQPAETEDSVAVLQQEQQLSERINDPKNDEKNTQKLQQQDPTAEIENANLKPPFIIISAGDNLWDLATKIYGNGFEFEKIYASNKALIQNPDLIYPGQQFTVPK